MAYGSLAWVGRALAPLRESMTADLVRTIEQVVPVIDIDPDLAGLRAASIAENVVLLQHVLATGVDPATVGPPAGAVAYAQALARRGVPMSVLLRAYGLGQNRLLGTGIAQVLAVPGPDQPARIAELLDFARVYLDRITYLIGRIYDAERDRWLTSRQAARQQWVARLLAGGDVDVAAAEAALGYPLDRAHLAAEIWLPPAVGGADTARTLDQARQLLAAATRADGDLVMATGDRELRVWFPVDATRPPPLAALPARIESAGLPVRVALGPVGDGPAGFRRSARGAARARALAVSAGPGAPAVVDFAAVAPFALLSGEPEELAGLVAVLGALAREGAKTELLRHTLEVFLAEDGSHARTAAALDVHRNTVHYRIQQITGRYGIDLGADTFGIRFALGVCRWHPRVLAPAEPAVPGT